MQAVLLGECKERDGGHVVMTEYGLHCCESDASSDASSPATGGAWVGYILWAAMRLSLYMSKLLNAGNWRRGVCDNEGVRDV